MSDHPKRVDAAVAIISRGGQVLLCQRLPDSVLGGYWEFPGGKVHPGESLHECLMREVREELDIKIQPRLALPVILHDYPHAAVRLHPFLCDHVAGEPKLIGCQQAIWIHPRELLRYQLPPANDSLITEILAHLA